MSEPYLPKWAKEKIETLEMQLSESKKRIAEYEEAISGDGGGAFSYGRYGESTEVRLPSTVRNVRVNLDSGFEIEISSDSKAAGGSGREGFVQLMRISWHGLTILPQAGNVIHVGPGRG